MNKYILFGLTCLFLISGCITKRGHSLNTGNLVRGPDGIWRLKSHTNPVQTPPPKITNTIIKTPPVVVPPPVSKPVKFPPIKTRPIPSTPKSANPNPTPIEANSSPAKLPPFKPSILNTKNLNVRTAVLPIATEEENVDNPSQESNIEEEAVVINWAELGMFYLIIILLAMGGWVSYDMWRDNQNAKRAMLASKRKVELDKKEKATKKRKPAEKKVVKKKVVKKKKLDTKNQRKSTQATRKKPKSS